MNPADEAAAFARFDEAAREIGALSSTALARHLESVSTDERWETLRMRWRWRLDEFADVVMRPILARRSQVSDPNELDDAIYQAPVYRVGARPWTTQRIVMTGRGVGKTTRQKIRAFHGLIYGCRLVSVTIAQTDTDAKGWIESVSHWAQNPSDEVRLLFPGLEIGGNENMVNIGTRYGVGTLIARGFTGALRGLNKLVARPDALDLDDIESEDRSITENARDNNQRRLLGKVLPLVPLEGGAEVMWTQTPVHHDAIAVRAYLGHKELRGWDVRRLPVLRAWPGATALWDECERIWFDTETYLQRDDAKTAARAFYDAHRAEMDEGGDVLDPQRMGVFACYAKLWEVGPTAFDREYMMGVSAAGGGKLQASKWPRFVRRGHSVHFCGRNIVIAEMALRAHYDPSDGGDDGALVVTGEHRGRYFLLLNQAWQGVPISQQTAEIPGLLKEYAGFGLPELQWEPVSGAASAIRGIIEQGLADAEVELGLIDKPSTENKNSRIISTLEPLGAGNLLTLPDDIEQRLVAQAEGFDDARRDNDDDWLDSVQRSVEAHMTQTDGPDPKAMLAALDSGDW